MIESDDFASGSLDPVWSIDGPAGISAGLASNTTNGYLELVTPDGDFDVWNTNNGARVMQATADTDFQIETHFLSTPTEKFQLQGLLVEQDADNWLRLDTYSNGSKLFAFASITVDGVSSVAIKVRVPGDEAPYLRVTRVGDDWTLEYSTDGTAWTTAGSFNHALNVSSTGVFAGNSGSATGFTAQVDYFENTANPILNEDGTIVPVNAAPDAVDDALVTDEDVALVIDVTADLLANDSDQNGDTFDLTEFTQTTNGTLIDNGDGTFTYTPDAGYAGTDTFTYTISDGSLTDTATVTIDVDAPTQPSNLASDDFAGGVLDPIWTIEGPAETSGSLATNTTDGYLELVTPDGDYNIWNVNNGARAMQATDDTDFQVEVGFLSTPTQRYQIQGLLVEEDADNWLRFDTYSSGSKLFAAGTITVDGVSTRLFKTNIPGAEAPYLRLTRTDDDWTLEYSVDGVAWNTAGSLTHASTVTKTGVVAGNTSGATGFTALVDYFENTAQPILDEDGTIVPINNAPDAVDDGLVTPVDTTLTINVDADLLANDSDQNGDTFDLTEFTQTTNGTLIDNGDGTFTYTPDAGYAGTDTFTYTISDGSLTDTATVTIDVDAPTQPSNLASDDFAGGVLDPIWTIEGPAETSGSLATNTTDGYLELVTPDGDYNIWNVNNGARAMQATDDTDFQVEVGFLSTPTQRYQIQGLLVEEDADNWLRFDTYSSGSKLFAAGTITVDGVSTRLFKTNIPGAEAPYLRLTRTDDDWTLEYSVDGVAWNTAGSLTHASTVTKTGVVAGNTSGATGFTALVDYFENTAQPILDEDGTIVPINNAPDAVDDGLVTPVDTTLTINVDADLLANDSDQNGDTFDLTEFTQTTNGTLIDNGDGTFTYTPDAGYAGTDTFTYTISDGSLTDTATVTIDVDAPTQPSNLASDDFAGGVLDPIWTIEGPAETSGSLATNTTDGYLELVTPDGDYNIWNVNNGARAMQATDDTDFQVEVGFLSTPTQRYQIQGLLVEEDADNWLRFDTYSSGSKLFAAGTITVDGVSTRLFKTNIPGAEAPYLRLTRTDDDWTLEYSVDGVAWNTAGSLTHASTVTKTGVVAGNTSGATGFTALVDYFENTAQPILDEDGTIVPINNAPDAVDDGLVTPVDTTLTINVDADLLANDSDQNGDTFDLTEFTQTTNGTLIDNGDGTFTYTPDAGYAGTDTFTYTISDGSLTDTATVTIAIGDPINLFYGSVQSFGSPGEGQEWVNILGNVAGSVQSLSYSLNGEPVRTLSIGSDGLRLQNPGDFNIDISYSELDGSAADDIVTIIATYTGGATVTSDVTIEYESSNVWSPNYSIDWATVTDIQDVVQVADGTWSFDTDEVRPVDTGYDRLLVLGDQGWDNYEMSTTVTLNSQFEDPDKGGGFSIGMLWDGHTDSRFGDIQPISGWEPGAMFFYQNNEFKSRSYHDWTDVLGDTPKLNLENGVEYNLTVRVEQVGVYDRLYSLKIWDEGTAEPLDWTVQGFEAFDLSEAPASGSIYLNAHYFDVTFGDLTVTEIAGSDIIQGTNGSDLLVAVDLGSGTPGQSEIDVFTGNAGADVFVFGDADGTYYDDGNRADTGEADYGFVWDFASGEDQVQLSGIAADYTLTTDAPGLAPGTAIWRISQNGDQDELVGVLNNAYGLDLNENEFVFIDTLLV